MNAKAIIEQVIPGRKTFVGMYVDDGIMSSVDPAHVTMRMSEYEHILPNGYYEYPNKVKVGAKSDVEIESDRITIDGVIYYLAKIDVKDDNGFKPKYPKFPKHFIGDMDIQSALKWLKNANKISDYILFISYNGEIDMCVLDSDDFVSGFWHYESSVKVESESIINAYPIEYMIDIFSALVDEGYSIVGVNVGHNGPIELVFGRMLNGKWALAPRIDEDALGKNFMSIRRA